MIARKTLRAVALSEYGRMTPWYARVAWFLAALEPTGIVGTRELEVPMIPAPPRLRTAPLPRPTHRSVPVRRRTGDSSNTAGSNRVHRLLRGTGGRLRRLSGFSPSAFVFTYLVPSRSATSKSTTCPGTFDVEGVAVVFDPINHLCFGESQEHVVRRVTAETEDALVLFVRCNTRDAIASHANSRESGTGRPVPELVRLRCPACDCRYVCVIICGARYFAIWE